MKNHLLPYVIIGVLTFFCAEGLICLYEHVTKKTAPFWIFTPLWILSLFLLSALYILLCLFWVVYGDIWAGFMELIRKKNVHNTVTATGEIGTVYTTRTGMKETNPVLDEFGWEQTDATKRIRVRAEKDELAVHSTRSVWKRIQASCQE